METFDSEWKLASERTDSTFMRGPAAREKRSEKQRVEFMFGVVWYLLAR